MQQLLQLADVDVPGRPIPRALLAIGQYLVRCIRIRCIARICHDGVGGDDRHDPMLFTVNTVKFGHPVLRQDIANAPSLRLQLANALPENQISAPVEGGTFVVARHPTMVFVKANPGRGHSPASLYETKPSMLESESAASCKLDETLVHGGELDGSLAQAHLLSEARCSLWVTSGGVRSSARLDRHE